MYICGLKIDMMNIENGVCLGFLLSYMASCPLFKTAGVRCSSVVECLLVE